jgi:predicted nucleotidyltransferase
MIQEEFRDFVFKFAKHASVNGVAYIILFGSVAKGDADRRSDVDILVVLDTYSHDFDTMEVKKMISELALTLEKEYDRNIQVVFTNKKYEGLDEYFVEKVMREGIVIFSHSASITIDGLESEPYSLIIYGLGDISIKEKMRVKRLMYGHRSKKIIKGKTYISEKIGLIHQLQGLRIAAGAVAIPQKKINDIENELNKLNITYKKLDIWLTRDSIRKMQISNSLVHEKK